MSAVVWWEIETNDPEGFQQFHSALSGWTFERAFEVTELEADYWIIKANDKGIGGLQRKCPNQSSVAGTRVYLSVENL